MKNTDQQEITESLANSPLFRGLPGGTVSRLLELGKYTPAVYQKGELIAVESQECRSIGIVVAGSVQVQKIYPSGRVVILDTLQKGSIFGEVIVFSKMNTYPATILSVTDSLIVFILKDGIKELCGMSTDFLENFLALLSNKVLTLNKKVTIMSYKTIREKITNLLLEQHRNQQSSMVMLPFNRNEMADFLGIPRPSLSRELIAMRDEGLIDFYKNTVKLVDLDGLENGLLT